MSFQNLKVSGASIYLLGRSDKLTRISIQFIQN